MYLDTIGTPLSIGGYVLRFVTLSFNDQGLYTQGNKIVQLSSRQPAAGTVQTRYRVATGRGFSQ